MKKIKAVRKQLMLFALIATLFQGCCLEQCKDCPQKPNCNTGAGFFCLENLCPQGCCDPPPTTWSAICAYGNDLVPCNKGDVVFISTKRHQLYYYYDFGGGDCAHLPKISGTIAPNTKLVINVPTGKQINIRFWKVAVSNAQSCQTSVTNACCQTYAVGASGDKTCAVYLDDASCNCL